LERLIANLPGPGGILHLPLTSGAPSSANLNRSAGRSDQKKQQPGKAHAAAVGLHMTRAIMAISGSAAALLPRPFRRLRNILGAVWRELAHDHYRPELHYMRGPGPAWRAKHGGHTSP
jgi:hypothetical protein